MEVGWGNQTETWFAYQHSLFFHYVHYVKQLVKYFQYVCPGPSWLELATWHIWEWFTTNHPKRCNHMRSRRYSELAQNVEKRGLTMPSNINRTCWINIWIRGVPLGHQRSEAWLGLEPRGSLVIQSKMAHPKHDTLALEVIPWGPRPCSSADYEAISPTTYVIAYVSWQFLSPAAHVWWWFLNW